MQNKLDKLTQNLTIAFKGDDIIVDSILFEHKGKYNFLTVTLDKVGGIDLETIVEATKVVNEYVDKTDICDDSFILDVVSKERG